MNLVGFGGIFCHEVQVFINNIRFPQHIRVTDFMLKSAYRFYGNRSGLRVGLDCCFSPVKDDGESGLGGVHRTSTTHGDKAVAALFRKIIDCCLAVE